MVPEIWCATDKQVDRRTDGKFLDVTIWHIPYWATNYFLEAICPRYGTNTYYLSSCKSKSQKSVTFTVISITGVLTMQNHIKICNTYFKN